MSHVFLVSMYGALHRCGLDPENAFPPPLAVRHGAPLVCLEKTLDQTRQLRMPIRDLVGFYNIGMLHVLLDKWRNDPVF
jgi:hypothetical protein